MFLAFFAFWAALVPWLRERELGARIFGLLDQPLLGSDVGGVSLLLLIKAGSFLFILIFLARYLRVFIGSALIRSSGLEEGQRYAIERVAGYVIVLFGAVIGLQVAGINLSSLAVVGGALGLGVGLGLQQAANNFLSGLILLMERPVKVGDRIEVGNLDGDVEKIGARATWIRTNADITVIVPNSDLVMRQVINWTAARRNVRFDVKVGVSYRSIPAEVKEVLLEVARRNPDVLDTPEPDVVFSGFGDSSLDFILRVWTRSKVRTPGVLRSDLYFALFEEFGRRGIEIPYPQRDLHLRSADAPIRVEKS
jgi:small-conductance mechanosensitive channel